MKGGPNHIGLCAADFAAIDAMAWEIDFIRYSHPHYEPCCRFYFQGDGVTKFEIVSSRHISPIPVLGDVLRARLS